MSELNVLSLFAGIGGLELGLERAGMTTVGQVEMEALCRSILARHWPAVPRHDDVRTTPEWWSSDDRPRVDVVCGGFPCQPFSTAGLRQGTTDERWGWPWMADVIRAVRPRYVLVENVATLLRDTDAFGWLLADLASLGFDAEWGVLTACAVGAPHTRDRLFVVAYPNGGAGFTRIRPEQDGPGSLQGFGDRARSWRDRVDWSVEAACLDGRDVDGLASGLVKAGGNAVVPAASEHLGRLMVADAATRIGVAA